MGDGSDIAFRDWLGSISARTAKVDNYPSKPTFTTDFLAGYRLIILAGLGDNSNTGPWWTFSAAEIAAFPDWVVKKGGGVISLSGYSNDNNDIVAKNVLLAFSRISHRQDCNSPACTLVDAQNNKMCYRCGNPYQLTEWNRSDPVIANLSLGVTMIGVDGGRPIDAPADAHVAATVTQSTGVDNWLVGRIMGQGRVLVYAEEWITYTDQWRGDNGATDPSCNGQVPATLYQTAQVWYNMVHWAQPNNNCFKIVDAQQPVTIWSEDRGWLVSVSWRGLLHRRQVVRGPKARGDRLQDQPRVCERHLGPSPRWRRGRDRVVTSVLAIARLPCAE